MVRENVAIVLYRMKKTIEINEEYTYIIVEPGVILLTFTRQLRARV